MAEHPPSMKCSGDLVKRLATAKKITVLTGAGVSAESGVPTFRAAQTGLWAQYNPEELATPEAFRRNPRLVWEWYAWRRELVGRAQPNAAHRALVQLENLAAKFSLITQNVDGLHQRAGSRTVVELHGNIHRTKCFDDGELVDHWPETGELPPKCPRCGGLLRPDVVWFNENLPPTEWTRAMLAATTCEVLLSIGTSSVVYPAASLPVEAKRHGATVVEINPQPTPLTKDADYAISGLAGEVVPELVHNLQDMLGTR